MSRLLYRFLAQVARLAVRSGRSKDLQIIVLRHENTILRRQVGRPALTDEDRTLLGAIAAALPKAQRQGWIVTPETLLRWPRRRIDAFDEIFRNEGLKILRTPARVPIANTFAERWIGSIRRELLNNPQGCPVPTIWNRQQLERLVRDYIDHHNTHRPHQSLDQRPPTPTSAPPETPPPTTTVLRTSRYDGLIHEYQNAA